MRLVWCFFFFHLCRVTELKNHSNHFFLCFNQDSYGMAVNRFPTFFGSIPSSALTRPASDSLSVTPIITLPVLVGPLLAIAQSVLATLVITSVLISRCSERVKSPCFTS